MTYKAKCLTRADTQSSGGRKKIKIKKGRSKLDGWMDG